MLWNEHTAVLFQPYPQYTLLLCPPLAPHVHNCIDEEGERDRDHDGHDPKYLLDELHFLICALTPE